MSRPRPATRLATAAEIVPPGDDDAPRVALCADDFAMTEGITRAVEELARADRLTATSAMVTLPHWPAHAPRLAALRRHIVLGLHVNLTLGRPATRSRTLAPHGEFLPLGRLLARALTGQLDRAEVAAEVAGQIRIFADRMGHLPEMIDGHQHVHALPGVRAGFIDALDEAWPERGVLVRDPAPAGFGARFGAATRKRATIAALSAGFGAAVRRSGFSTNDGFAGVSNFAAASPYAAELSNAFARAQSRHLVMCHPGYVDDELVRLDPVTTRREEERAVIAAVPWLPARIATRAQALAWLDRP